MNGWQIHDIKIYPDKRNTYAVAECHCGNIVEVPLTKINGGYKKDCGCGHKTRLNQIIYERYGHLIGTTINNWTVLEIIPSSDNAKQSFALCQCECGTVKNVRLTYLINGRSKDCGCGRKAMLRETRTKNLVGQHFGKLTVVELLEESNQFGRRVYRCVCACGNEVICDSLRLITGHTLSCGCLRSQWNAKIASFLKDSNIASRPEMAINLNGRIYRFDFYLPDYNLMIEYDGEQHYYPVNFGGWNEADLQQEFERIQQSDILKTAYCADNNINLLRIPYWECKNIETIISNHLQRLSEKGSAA